LDPNVTDEDGNLRASFKQFFSEGNIPVDLKLKDDDTALHCFARYGLPRFVRLLLTMGANINSQNCVGNTPVHVAVLGGHTSAFIVLAKYNPRTDIKNEDEETVRDIIEQHSDRKHYIKYLPKTTRNATQDTYSFINDVEPEYVISDEETFSTPNAETPKASETENQGKKDGKTQNMAEKRENKWKKDTESDDSGPDETLNSDEEIEVEEKVRTHITEYSLDKSYTKEERRNETNRIRAILREEKLDRKKLNHKKRKNKERKERREKLRSETEIERIKQEKLKKEKEEKEEKEKANQLENERQEKRDHVVKKLGKQLVNEIVKIITNQEKLEELFDNHRSRDEILQKNQQSTQLRQDLKELLHQLRIGSGDDEFNYEEVIEILRNI